MPRNLPESTDVFWEDGEVTRSSPREIKICPTHARHNWTTHVGYIDNGNGTISCKYCPWGAILSNVYRVKDEKIVDLRSVIR